MKKHKIKYTNESIGKIKIVKDFLPSPDDLILKDETVKITLILNKSSVDFFKQLAEKKHTHYQKMIRVLLAEYVSHFDQK